MTMILIGTWLNNPYIAFAVGAVVEIGAYFVIHLVLDRWGRKIPYCVFVFLFGIIAFLVVPIQMYMEKDGRGTLKDFSRKLKNVSNFSTVYLDVYCQCDIEISRFGIVCNHLYICK